MSTQSAGGQRPPITPARQRELQFIGSQAVRVVAGGGGGISSANPSRFIIPPFRARDLCTTAARSLWTIGVPAFAGVLAAYAVVSGQAEQDPELGLAAGFAIAGVVNTAFSGAKAYFQRRDAIRIGVGTQAVTVGIGAAISLGLQATARAIYPPLGGPQAPDNGTVSLNATDINATDIAQAGEFDHWPEGAPPVLALLVVSLPCAAYLSAVLWPREDTGFFQGIADKIQYTPNDDGRIVQRHPRLAKAVREGAPVAVVVIAGAILGGAGGAGYYNFVFRSMVVLSQTAISARCRDFFNMMARQGTSGGLSTVQGRDNGWFSKIQLEVPQEIYDLIDKQIPDKREREVAKDMVRARYESVYTQSRLLGILGYGGASYFGLTAVREFFSPSAPGVYPLVEHATRTAILSLLGTAFVEGFEEWQHTKFAEVLASWHGLTIQLTIATGDPMDSTKANFRNIDGVVLLPVNRLCAAHRKATVTVADDGSIAVKLTLAQMHSANTSIRTLQNIVTAWLFTAAGVAEDPATKMAFFMTGSAFNGLTHFRNWWVQGVLLEGYTNKLKYEAQSAEIEEILIEGDSDPDSMDLTARDKVLIEEVDEPNEDEDSEDSRLVSPRKPPQPKLDRSAPPVEAESESEMEDVLFGDDFMNFERVTVPKEKPTAAPNRGSSASTVLPTVGDLDDESSSSSSYSEQIRPTEKPPGNAVSNASGSSQDAVIPTFRNLAASVGAAIKDLAESPRMKASQEHKDLQHDKED